VIREEAEEIGRKEKANRGRGHQAEMKGGNCGHQGKKNVQRQQGRIVRVQKGERKNGRCRYGAWMQVAQTQERQMQDVFPLQMRLKEFCLEGVRFLNWRELLAYG
jgi:hypothetical protein